MTDTAHPGQRIRHLPRAAQAILVVLMALMGPWVQAGTLGVFTSGEQGFDTHTFYYDDGQEVVLIDTQFVPALTDAMLAQIRRETYSPVTRVVVTHPNPDKFNGLARLHALGVRSVSSGAVAAAMPAVHRYKEDFWVHRMKAFAPGAYPAFEPVQETFEHAHQLRLKSGQTLSLFALRHGGVATSQVVVRIDATGDLLVGDLVHHRAHAWLEGGLVNGRPTPRIDEWLAALDELPALAQGHPQAKVYGGRGEFVRVAEAVAAQKAYLTGAQQLTQAFLASEPGAAQALRDPGRAEAQYGELTRRFEQRFPDYRLPYMVRYSVYGLAQSMLESSPGHIGGTVLRTVGAVTP